VWYCTLNSCSRLGAEGDTFYGGTECDLARLSGKIDRDGNSRHLQQIIAATKGKTRLLFFSGAIPPGLLIDGWSLGRMGALA